MAKMTILTSAAIMCALLLFGCNAEETRTVEWYRAPENKAALEIKLAECKNNPGELRNTPNCINARKAFELNFTSGKFDKVREPDFGLRKK